MVSEVRTTPRRVVVVNAGPRRDGNSAAMSQEVARGAADAGHDVVTVWLDDYVSDFVRDCRTCRDAAGNCTIGDRFRSLLFECVLPADAMVLATPLHYYGMTGRLKVFFDRLFCYTSGSAPSAPEVVSGLRDKRVLAVVSLEESYPGAVLSVTAHLQEITRYAHQQFLGVVVGVGNVRGEVARDPLDPLGRCYDAGQALFDTRFSDYRIDTPRASRVWT